MTTKTETKPAPATSAPAQRPLARIQPALAALSLIVSARYLFWRATETLNFQSPGHTAVSVLLLFAELYGSVSMALYFVQALKPPTPSVAAPEPAADKLPSADVFITVFDEPVAVLYKTLVCCAALDYPKEKLNVYVLDDGPRQAVRAMAEKFGFRYLSREDRLHAKAGNVNNGLKHSKGDLVLLLDCDHIPVRTILRETVGYFQNERVAYVQLPHHFYNPDVFQHNLHLDDDLIHEQDLFFQVIQPGRQASNSVVFAGSSAVLRRSALQEIGGLRTETAIEDTHTGMTLHARGYKAIFHNKILSAGLSPESFQGYLTQRQRWTRGGVQIFVIDNPLLVPGLSIKQRLTYMSSLLYFFHGWSRLVFLVAPLAFLLLGYEPIVANIWTLLSYFLPHYIFTHMAFNTMSRSCRNPFWSDVYEAAGTFALSWSAVKAVLNPQRLVFRVTPKGVPLDQRGTKWSLVVPHMVMMGLLVAGVVMATIRFQNTDMHMDAYLLSGAWAVFNLMLLGCSIEGARERHQLRAEYRVDKNIPCVLSYHGKAYTGTVTNMSPSGLQVRLESKDHIPPLVHVKLKNEQGEISEFSAEVVHQEEPFFGGHRVGLKITDENEPLRQSIIRRMFSTPDSWNDVERPVATTMNSLWHLASSAIRPRMRKVDRQLRNRARIAIDLPIDVVVGDSAIPAQTVDISVTGACFRVRATRELPDEIVLRLPFKDGGTLVKAKRQWRRGALKKGDPDLYGVRFVQPNHLNPADLEGVEDVTSG